MKQKLIYLLPNKLFLLLKGYGWYGNFDNWKQAEMQSEGYDSDFILSKVKESTLKVKNGEAVYERDSVLFDKIEYSWELLTMLMWIAAQNKGELNVIDFGGSLGSTYYQNKTFLDTLSSVSWNIVEQANFVDEGKKDFETDNLKFYSSIKECISDKQKPIDLLLFSGVLQYLECPYKLLDEAVTYKTPYIFIDRTGFAMNDKDRITVQKVPSYIYKGSYPCWFFGERKFHNFFKQNNYELITEFKALDVTNIPSQYKGFIYKRNNA